MLFDGLLEALTPVIELVIVVVIAGYFFEYGKAFYNSKKK